MGLFSKLKIKIKSQKKETKEGRENVLRAQMRENKMNKSEAVEIVKQYFAKISMSAHIIDLNEKHQFPPEISNFSVEELANVVFILIQNDQLDAKIIGDVIIF